MGRRKQERTTKSRTNLSLIHFTVCHSQNSFVFNSRGSLKFSTLDTSRSTHEHCFRHPTAITNIGPHACVTEGRESRSSLTFLTISVPSNLQKLQQILNAASCALDATQLILSSRLSSKVFPTKHNYSFLRQNIVILFLERKETYTRWNRISDSTFRGR